MGNYSLKNYYTLRKPGREGLGHGKKMLKADVSEVNDIPLISIDVLTKDLVG